MFRGLNKTSYTLQNTSSAKPYFTQLCKNRKEKSFTVNQIYIKVIKSSRLRWAGHVRMDEKDLPKKILQTKPGVQRGRG
jgi:hypothetical protein